MKSILSRLVHLDVAMSRRSSGGADGIAADEGQSFGPEVLSSMSGVSPSGLEHGETGTAALVVTYLVTHNSYNASIRLCGTLRLESEELPPG